MKVFELIAELEKMPSHSNVVYEDEISISCQRDLPFITTVTELDNSEVMLG